MYPFDRFTERAKRVLTRAEEEARRAKHSYIGTEHLLAILGDEGALAVIALSNLGVEINWARAAIESALSEKEARTLPKLIPTSRVKTVIEMAFEEAHRLKQAQVSTEQPLLALLKEGKGIGAQALTSMGINVYRARAELDRLRGQLGAEN